MTLAAHLADADPHAFRPTLRPVFQKHAGDLPPLADARAVAQEKPFAAFPVRQHRLVGLARVRDGLQLRAAQQAVLEHSRREGELVRDRGRFYRRHR